VPQVAVELELEGLAVLVRAQALAEWGRQARGQGRVQAQAG
jgi:hypothetical protein